MGPSGCRSSAESDDKTIDIAQIIQPKGKITKMAPILSKFIKLKSGQKVPINPLSVKAIVKLSKIPKSNKIPVKHVPRPACDRELEEQNDPELQELIRDAEERLEARGIPVNRPQNRPENDQNRPQNEQNRPENDHNRPENIFTEDIGDILEPNLDLADITLAERAQLLMYPGTDKCKRSTFYLEYYPSFWHYYELYDCWDECPIKSMYLPFCYEIFDPFKLIFLLILIHDA